MSTTKMAGASVSAVAADRSSRGFEVSNSSQNQVEWVSFSTIGLES